jgi:hypothetical protein
MKRSRLLAVVSAAASLAGAAGIAYAVWDTREYGSAAADAGTAVPVSTDAVTLSSGDLYPGEDGKLKMVVRNGNKFTVRITGLHLDTRQGANWAVSGGSGGGANDISAAIKLNDGSASPDKNPIGDYLNTPRTIAKGDSLTLQINNAVHIGDTPNGCQNASITIPVLVEAQSYVAP